MRHATIYYPRAMHGDGGATNSLWMWADALARAGVVVEVLHDPRLPELPSRQVPGGVTTRGIRHAGSRRLVRPVGLDCELNPSTVLFLHSGYVLFNLVAGAAAVRADVPYVVMPQGAYNTQVRGRRPAVRHVWEFAERRLLHRATAVHVALPPEVDRVRRLAPEVTTVVAPTPLELPRSRWRAHEAEGYVAWLGRYDVRHKGIDRLLDALVLLPEAVRPPVRMRGRDHHQSRSDIQVMVDRRGLTASVDVGPPVDGAEKERFLLGAAAFVHPSRWESFPVALLESLALGVPCLTTVDIDLGAELSVAGAAEVVDASPTALAEGLRSAGAGALASHGPRGRAYVAERLSHRRVGRELLDGLAGLQASLDPAS